jgi:hypothetical protein
MGDRPADIEQHGKGSIQPLSFEISRDGEGQR